MKLNKFTLIALAAGSLLMLGTALRAQDSTNTPPAGGPPGGGPGMRGRGPNFDVIVKQLQLTDDQKPKVKAILDDQMQQMRDLRQDDSLSPNDRRAKMKSIRDDANTKLQGILTADQYAQWLKMNQRRRPGPPPANGSSNTNTPPVTPPPQN